MIHEFLPPNFLDSLLHSTYWPKSHFPNSFDRKLWNPWNDPNVDSFILLRFALLREYKARDPESQSLFWRHMSREAECIAEAERDMFEDLYRLVFELECEYVESTYLDKELESLDEAKFAKKIAARIGTTESVEATTAIQSERVRVRFGTTRFMLPPDFLGHQRYNAQLLGEVKDKSEPIVVRPIRDVTKTFLRKWGDSTSYLYSEIMQSSRLMHQDIIRAGAKNNTLVGPSSKNRRLLTNSHIPVPDLLSFLGWFGFVGYRWDRINVKTAASLEGIIGYSPQTLLTFGIPVLPITREHQGGYGASIAQEDAHSNHSLSARNPAHSRDQFGRILHGYYLAVTATIGGGPPTILVESQIQQSNVTPKAIVTEHYSVMPESVRFEGPVITAGLNSNMRFGMLGLLSNPWGASPAEMPLPYEWQEFTNLQFDMPFRALARWNGTMFRFDDIPQINNWVENFIKAAAEWYGTTRAERSVAYFDAVLDDWIDREPNVVTPKNGKGRFDFSILDDSDE